MPSRKAREPEVLQVPARSQKIEPGLSPRAESALMSQFLRTSQAAKELNLSVGTVQKLVETNQLHAWKTLGGHRRISIDSVEAYKNLIRDHQEPADDPATTEVLKVLFIDSNKESLNAVEKAVKNISLNITGAYLTSGFEAMFQLTELKPDVVFSELDLPDLDGAYLLRKIDSSTAMGKMGLVALTSLNAAQIETRGGLPHRAVVLRKPIHTAWVIGYLTAIETMTAAPNGQCKLPNL